MAMTLASIKKAVDKKPPFSLLYGVDGVGKTSLAAEYPSPVFLRTYGEDYPRDLSPDEFGEAKSFDDVIDALEVLAKEDHAFETFCLDAIDGLEGLIHKETCRRNKWETIEALDYGKGYVAADGPWEEVLEWLEVLRVDRGMNIVLLGHANIVKFNSPTSDPYDRYSVNLHKRAAGMVQDACDLIAFVNFQITLKSVDGGFGKKTTHGEGGGTRKIYVEERPGFHAKNRFGMPPSIDYKKGDGYAALSKYLAPEAK